METMRFVCLKSNIRSSFFLKGNHALLRDEAYFAHRAASSLRRQARCPPFLLHRGATPPRGKRGKSTGQNAFWYICMYVCMYMYIYTRTHLSLTHTCTRMIPASPRKPNTCSHLKGSWWSYHCPLRNMHTQSDLSIYLANIYIYIHTYIYIHIVYT
jgi:hypothetical protein